jgi:hypothetical protein
MPASFVSAMNVDNDSASSGHTFMAKVRVSVSLTETSVLTMIRHVAPPRIGKCKLPALEALRQTLSCARDAVLEKQQLNGGYGLLCVHVVPTKRSNTIIAVAAIMVFLLGWG